MIKSLLSRDENELYGDVVVEEVSEPQTNKLHVPYQKISGYVGEKNKSPRVRREREGNGRN